ncbi:NnrU family protein [Pseudaquabacterium pictum]|uniref:NnrU protein n=1 Tax=Pseudaquabacterium pictum TaxID=2315236 RepID=A0A480ATS9_9BURK|nr:NnrU family protein [Rubrivivax pictus]GCL64270.1 NnrU protein [Rubrivivax pictus]
MSALILGLLMFLGMHSSRIVAEGWRTQVIAQRGPGAWKGLYTVVSLVGFGLIIWGYGQARMQPVVLWESPVWTRHLAALLVLVALVLLAAAQVPGNGIKARVHHPMVLGVKVWALAHLLANNTLADLLLFGSFLVWAVLDFRSSRQRDRAAGTVYPPGSAGRTVVAVVLGVLLWAAFAFWLHGLLFGVRPFGR